MQYFVHLPNNDLVSTSLMETLHEKGFFQNKTPYPVKVLGRELGCFILTEGVFPDILLYDYLGLFIVEAPCDELESSRVITITNKTEILLKGKPSGTNPKEVLARNIESLPRVKEFIRLPPRVTDCFFFPHSTHRNFRVSDDMVRGYQWNGNAEPKKFYEIAKKFSEKIGRKIILEGGTHGEVKDPDYLREVSKNGEYVIFMWGGVSCEVSDEAPERVPERLWDISLPNSSRATNHLIPGGEGEEITSDRGVPVAEVCKDSMSLLFDLFQDAHENVYKVFEKILEESEMLYKIVSGVLPREELDKIQLERFRKSLKVPFEKMGEDLKIQYDRAVKAMDQFQKELTKSIREKERASTNLTKYSTELADFDRYADEQILRIKKLEPLSSIKLLSEYKFVFFTKPITCVDERTKKTHLLGRYKVVVDMTNSDIRIFNLDRTIQGFGGPKTHHPHVMQGNSPCLGSLASIIANTCSTKDVYSTTHCIIQFLGSSNPSDQAGWHIHRFPELVDGKEVPVDESKFWNKCGRGCGDCRSSEECKKAGIYPRS